MGLSLYRSVLAPLLFRLEPERAHHLSLALARLAAFAPIRAALESVVFSKPAPALKSSLMGLTLRSPICIAAGLDKDCEAFEALSATGVGAIELGTVTPEPQPGNPPPRLFRLPAQGSLINRLGFPSCGITLFRNRLQRVRRRDVVLGVNIGKNKDTALENCESDYERCTRELGDLADYITLNVSSPNTPGLRALQTPEKLSRVINAVQSANRWGRPLAVKVSPDCTPEQVLELVDCCVAHKIAAVIATNTTLARPPGFASSEAGGLSGELLRERALETISMVLVRARGSALDVVAAGGITSGPQVSELLDAGCKAVQVYSALVFCGPGLIGELNRDLQRRLSAPV